MKIITSVHEGLHNVPRLYGSEVREKERVTGFGSGVKAGGKVTAFQFSLCRYSCKMQALFQGYYDGITGLVTEPLEGAKKEVQRNSIGSTCYSVLNY